MADSNIRVEGIDDDMGVAFECAVADEDSAGLAAIAAYYRARWCESDGRLSEINRVIAAKDEIIAYLKAAVNAYAATMNGRPDPS